MNTSFQDLNLGILTLGMYTVPLPVAVTYFSVLPLPVLLMDGKATHYKLTTVTPQLNLC